MAKANIHSRLSTEAMRHIALESGDSPVIINLTDDTIDFTPFGRERLERTLKETGAAIVYSDYHTVDTDGRYCRHELIDWQSGALRDDFDFGKTVVVNPLSLIHI